MSSVKRLINPQRSLTTKKDKIKSEKSANKHKFFENQIGESPQEWPALFGKDHFFSPENAALFLDVSRKFIYELIARGELPAVTVGGRLRRIRRRDLENWLTSSNKGARL